MEESVDKPSRACRIARGTFLLLAILQQLAFILVFVVVLPQFRFMFKEVGVELPSSTAFLLSLPTVVSIALFAVVATLLIAKEYLVSSKKLAHQINIGVILAGFALLAVVIVCLYQPMLMFS